MKTKKMIKTCKAYKLTCDACGRQIGGVFARKDIACGVALVNGFIVSEKPLLISCSLDCKAKLLAALPKPTHNDR